jgi:hypothetical protein
MSEISGGSAIMKVVKNMTRKGSQKVTSVFPTTLLYSFSSMDFGLALSFFPASEMKTHIRYDLFSRSVVGQTEVQKLSDVLQKATEDLARETEKEYSTVSKEQGSVASQSRSLRQSSLICLFSSFPFEFNNPCKFLHHNV